MDVAMLFPGLLVVFIQLVCVAHSSEEHGICLSCPHVARPLDCQTYAEIWEHERCFTERILLLNGSSVYKFGHESASDCPYSDDMAPPPALQQRLASTDISMCFECCIGLLCNQRLCGLFQRNNTNLACVVGEDINGIPSRMITYCAEGERCYAGMHPHNTRPHQYSYGCASQSACDHLVSGLPDDRSSCQRCCSNDGCNAFICHSHVHRSTASGIDATTDNRNFVDCWDLRSRGGFTQSGVYDIYPAPTYSRLRVSCDMTTDGGGWTILQKRFDGSLSFTRTMQEYTDGFGDVSREYWIGLEWIHVLTTHGTVQMRIDLCMFNGSAMDIVYDRFNISGRNETYQLHAGTHTGGSIIWDLLGIGDGQPFQTSSGCSRTYRGGWWYTSCFRININGGLYNGNNTLEDDGIGLYWPSTIQTSLMSSEMKLRPAHVTRQISHPYTCPP